MGHRLDISNTKFGYLTAINVNSVSKSRAILWNCVCSCGNECVVSTNNLRNGHTKSCGCYMKKRTSEINSTHGKSRTSEYYIWKTMKSRCENKSNISYKYYGARGIMVCERWFNSFENFINDMGLRPSNKYSIDRIDNNGNYEPSNCKWATKFEQAGKKRSNKILEFNGETMILEDWARRLNITSGAISNHLRNGKSFESICNYYIKKHKNDNSRSASCRE